MAILRKFKDNTPIQIDLLQHTKKTWFLKMLKLNNKNQIINGKK